MTGQELIERFESVSRRWAAAASPLGRRHWRFWTPASVSELMTYLWSAVAVFLEVPEPMAPLVPPPLSGDLLLPVAVMVFFANGWLVDRHLGRKTAGDPGLRAGARVLRFIAGGVPLVGVYVLAVWRQVVEKQPGWAFQEPRATSARISGVPALQVGWRLARAHWGQGYATEAARAMLDFAFETLGVDRVYANIDPANAASIAVVRRLGMRDAGMRKYFGADDASFVLDRPA